MVKESITDRISTVEYWENGIIFFKLKDHVKIELPDAKLHYEYLKRRYDGKTKYRILVETGRYTDITKEAREFSSRPETNSMTMASAVIVKSLAHRLIINFMINMTNRQKIKMKMFDKKEKAIEWLLQLNQE